MPELFSLEQREDLGIASVMASRNASVDAIGVRLGLEMPTGPQVGFSGDLAIVGTGPGTWLAIREKASLDFAEELQDRMAGLAAISDQSSGYAVQRLCGPGARALLRKGVAMDLHPDRFRTGSAATSLIAHIGVILWQVDDRPTYDIATFRSYSASFRHWIEHASAAL